MAKITSLMYREWVLTKKTLLLGLAAAILMLMLGVFIGNGFRNGSLDGNERMHTMLAQTGYVPFGFMVALFLSVAAQNGAAIYGSDIKANWTRYSMTLPTDTKCRAFAHTLFLLVRIMAAFLLSLAAGAALASAFGKPFSAVLAVDIGLFCCISMLFVCFAEFFWSKAKDMISYKKQSNRLSAALAVAGVVIGLLFARSAGSGESTNIVADLQPLTEKYTAFRNAVQPFIIPVFIGLIALNYVIIKRNLDSLKHS